ncbi:MAG: M24 family metallopeptidase [Candidatus Marinimicrobia bacterium]|nr:M24 family metallopeptidase [Candidatus Neomarinimicrobiota bacterium]
MIRITDATLQEFQSFLAASGLDGWLLYDFHGLNPFARQFLPLDEGHFTRRYYYYLPANGAPTALVHRIEQNFFTHLPGNLTPYSGWQEMEAALADMLPKGGRVAMEYSPGNALPYVSCVDAGTVEMVSGLGVKVVSSADIIQQFLSRWSAEGYRLHMETVPVMHDIRLQAFESIATGVKQGQKVLEHEIQQQMTEAFRDAGLEFDHPPIVAVNAHAAMPHYAPSPELPTEMKVGDLVLIDMWARRSDHPEAIYVDITWTGFLGDQIPPKIDEVFQIVKSGRDAAVEFVASRLDKGEVVAGWEVDDACRSVIEKAGYGQFFTHRTGHSIDQKVHGAGVNIDHLEVRDDRQLIEGVGFSIEPGIYLPGEFGIRSEIDAYIGADGIEVTTAPSQDEVLPLLAMFE